MFWRPSSPCPRFWISPRGLVRAGCRYFWPTFIFPKQTETLNQTPTIRTRFIRASYSQFKLPRNNWKFARAFGNQPFALKSPQCINNSFTSLILFVISVPTLNSPRWIVVVCVMELQQVVQNHPPRFDIAKEEALLELEMNYELYKSTWK